MNPLLKIPDCEVGTRVPEKVRLLPFIIVTACTQIDHNLGG